MGFRSSGKVVGVLVLGLLVLEVVIGELGGRVEGQTCGQSGVEYQANWTSLDTRPNPAWYDEAKFGIFIHWGVYSVPSWAIPGPCCPNISQNPYAEWYWNQQMNDTTATHQFHLETYGPDFDYQDFAPQFTASLWSPDQWANLFQASGARYVVLTSKHHEGYTLWPSPQSWNWNAVDVGPGRDLVAALANATRAVGLKFGIYYSLYEWFNPIYLSDPKAYIAEVMLPQMYDLIKAYQPSIFWGDGCDDYDSYFWGTPEFMAWLYNESPVCDEIVINDRWGNDTQWQHGGFYTSEEEWPSYKKFGNHKWEDNRGMAWSYGYNRMENITWFFPPQWYVNLLVELVSNGGNLLLDVGPTHDGIIPPNMEYILLEMGSWLSVNGEAIYSSSKWRVTNESDATIRYTWNTANSTLYVFILEWPSNSVLQLVTPIPVANATATVEFVGLPNTTIAWNYESGQGWSINLPLLPPNAYPCNYVYVLRIQNVQ